MEILDALYLPDIWQEFLQHKMEKQHLSKSEQEKLEKYIREQKYIEILCSIENSEQRLPIPVKKEINKGGVSRKRVVYTFPEQFNIVLKAIAFSLYRYDDLFAANCYAFRRSYGVRDAVKRIRMTKGISKKYCLKVDIHDYFNSIDVPVLVNKLDFLRERDDKIFQLFERILTEDKALVKEKIVSEKRGAMAGTPISPFLANVYLMELDWYFENRGSLYFRYSDDILVFANTREELEGLQGELYEWIARLHLTLNPQKVHVSQPGEIWEFLGFCYRNGRVDLSENTKRKIKGKIKRKAHALRRWQVKKGLSGDKAAKGFIRAMNHKFFDWGEGTDFCWSRWFFPNLTTDAGLKEIDAYMQQYIRYCVTGRHYKGNYRISYEQMKEWGYRSLVHEYYDYPCQEKER